MKTVAAALAVLALAGADAPAVTPESLLAVPHPEAFDYYALRDKVGVRGVMELRRAASAILEKKGVSFLGPDCISKHDATVLTGLLLAAQASSSEVFAADRAEGEALLKKTAADWARLQAGQDVPPHYHGAAALFLRSRAATDPRLRELFSRVARDQFVGAPDPRMMRNGPDAGIVDRPAFYASQVGMAEACAVNFDNTGWLKVQLKTHGWFSLSRYGEAADSAAFLIVQHSDRDRAFQREMLPVLEKLVAEKETQPRAYAYLYDRIAVAEKRPQRYATQGRCIGAKAWEPWPVEDEANIDRVRAGVGLGTLAEYKARFSCGG